jgi:RNA polymerase sigma-70 factor, ECF subfamily
VLQALRGQLLVGVGGALPRISEYAGHGDLRGWLRVSVVRSALKVLRRNNAGAFEDVDAVLEARSSDDDPELSYMKSLYRDAFRAAFRAAFDELAAREKNMLRQHFADGLTIDDLGRLYNVHRATAARWLQKARESLLAGTRREFTQRAGITARECESVLRLVQSRFDVTLRSLLG